MPTSLKAIFRDSLFITKVKVLLQCRSSEGFFFPAGTKKESMASFLLVARVT